MSCPLKDTRLAQIGFIVKDIEKTKKEFARFFDVPEPPTICSGDYAVTKVEYRGEPAPQVVEEGGEPGGRPGICFG